MNSDAILSQVMSPQTGMPEQPLPRLVDIGKEIYIQIRWQGPPASKDTQDPIQNVQRDVPQLLMNLLARKKIPSALLAKNHSELGPRSDQV